MLLGLIINIYISFVSCKILDQKYRGKCTLIFENLTITNRSQIPCDVAMFSATSNFVIMGELFYFDNDYCNPMSDRKGFKKSKILAAKRGVCAFDAKVVNAYEDGYNAVMIINYDDTIMPVGGTMQNRTIPTVMIGNSSIFRDIISCKTCKSLKAEIIYGNVTLNTLPDVLNIYIFT